LEFYKHVVKSRNARKSFLLCLRNPCENTFSKLPIFFFIKKSVQNMLGYWTYAWKHFFFIYMYICHIASKIGYSKYEIDIFYSIKTNSDLKINMLENHKSLSLSFIFWRKKNRSSRVTCLFFKEKKSRSGLVTCPCKWPGWTQKGCSYSLIKAGGLLFKWINSLEQ